MCEWKVPAQSELFGADDTTKHPTAHTSPNLEDYDRVCVFQSGGKDSIACILHLLDLGVAPSIIELHHHDVDGREGSTLMDWPITRDYCRAFAEAFGMKLYYSWKVGGFEREMLRHEARTSPTSWETIDGPIMTAGGSSGKLNTRRRFPQVSSDLSVRWCSSYLKVDPGAILLRSESRFLRGKTLVITGERAQESASRAKYATFEPYRADNRNGARVRRWIDHWRPIHRWTEEQVWEILARYRINPHPAYWLGWGRTSCMTCIFGSPNQWASVRACAPDHFEVIARYEEEFGVTIHRTLTVRQQADRGTPYEMDPEMVRLALGRDYSDDQIRVPAGQWRLPSGAFGESDGPT